MEKQIHTDRTRPLKVCTETITELKTLHNCHSFLGRKLYNSQFQAGSNNVCRFQNLSTVRSCPFFDSFFLESNKTHLNNFLNISFARDFFSLKGTGF